MTTRHYPDMLTPMPAGGRVLACAMLLLVGCGGGVANAPRHAASSHAALPAHWPTVAPDAPQAANAVLMRALSLVGTPYRFGGNTPEAGFDCSGLVGYVFDDMLARRLPRNSGELARLGAAVGAMQLATGDLVVFGEGARVTHVGIYVGEGRFVHAPSSGGTVRLDHLDGPYWRDHFQGGRRVLL